MEEGIGRKVYRALDRSVSFFGIRGRFVIVFAGVAAAGLAAALLVGFVTDSSLTGFIVFIGGAAGAYFVTTSLQRRYGGSWRVFSKYLASRRRPQFVSFRHHSVRSLLAPRDKSS